MNVSIKTLAEGQCFGVRAVVVDVKDAVVYETRIFPHGFDGAARQDAKDEAASRGWTVVEDEA